MDFKKSGYVLLATLCFLQGISQPAGDVCSRYCNFRTSSRRLPDSVGKELVNPNSLMDDTGRVQRAVEQILCLENISSKEFRSVAYDLYNASAVECNQKKIILYNVSFLQDVSGNDPYVMYGVLAHEIGHHILGSAWLSDSADSKKLYEAELAADEYSGIILGRLDVPVKEAVKCLNNVDNVATADHPAKQDRQKRLLKGWAEGQKNKLPEKERLYDLNCQTNIKANYEIAFDREAVRGSVWPQGKRIVTAYIRSVEGRTLDDISFVSYYLHPTTFKNNVFETKKRKSDFMVSLSLWGEFELRATIHMKDGSEFLLVKYLDVFGDRSQ